MSAIRQAAIKALYDIRSCPVLSDVLLLSLARTRPRLTRDQQRGWSTNLTFRTYNSLKNQGVLS